MPTNLRVSVPGYRPGTVADVAEALGRAGVNIEGGCAYAAGAEGVVNVLVEDAAAARRALERSGAEVVEEREVIVVAVEDRPGALGAILRRVADAGGNLNLLYLATGTRLVLGADDLEKVRAVA